ncbi:flagellar biosynthesis anti-sigma factor FlgM [Thalassorhabdus alkalitolerans]|uniref:Negative regulator of flagellin synthesis n=1 Tax=Thalassorhabdus alkalitolerans TaxID=2282697 RepID=A0ABW0YG11_9BACI
MNINPFGPVNHTNPYQKQAETHKSTQASEKKHDKVEISEAAKELQKKSSVELEREEKIQALKEKVEAGEYQVDSHAVAKKFYEYWSK